MFVAFSTNYSVFLFKVLFSYDPGFLDKIFLIIFRLRIRYIALNLKIFILKMSEVEGVMESMLFKNKLF